MDNDIIEDIRTEVSDLQANFITSIIKICDKYGANKTELIRSAVESLDAFVQISNFDLLEIK